MKRKTGKASGSRLVVFEKNEFVSPSFIPHMRLVLEECLLYFGSKDAAFASKKFLPQTKDAVYASLKS